MDWYKTLTIQQRINLKDLCESICGIRYDFLIRLFGMTQTIELIKYKLELEGFIL